MIKIRVILKVVSDKQFDLIRSTYFKEVKLQIPSIFQNNFREKQKVCRINRTFKKVVQIEIKKI